MVTDDEIKARLQKLLQESDLQTTTEKMLRKALEKELGEDLSGKKDLIRQEVNTFLMSQQPQEGESGGEEEEEEEEDEEEEGGSRKKKRGGGGGFSQKQCVLSEELQEFLGVKMMPRTQVVKEIWKYIKENELQDPKNKRNILVDEKLGRVLTAPVNMFSMNKQLTKHIKAAAEVCGGSDDDDEEEEEGGGGARPAKRARMAAAAAGKQRGGSGGGGSGGAEKKKRKGPPGKGMFGLLKISDELAAVTGNNEMTRGELTTWFWGYVKSNGLQDPADKSFVLADGTLKDLFGETRFKGFGFQKYLKQHIVGKSEGGAAASEVKEEAEAKGEEEGPEVKDEAAAGAGGGGAGEGQGDADGEAAEAADE